MPHAFNSNSNINQNIDVLAASLSEQCVLVGIEFEILAQDDASDLKQFNHHQSAIHVPNLSWERNNENLGRAGNRNFLANKARYDLLLFIDGDSLIENKNFISNYLSCASFPICYGGTSYQEEKPKDVKYLLHWKYAKKYEALSVKNRKENVYNSFHSNNFLIQKEVFKQNPFDETIMKYGYEDHLFAHNFKALNTIIHHIENPVYHAGLESNMAFLQKTEKAIENLSELYTTGKLKEGNLIKRYEQLKKANQLLTFSKILGWKRTQIKDNLLGNNPRLINFQLYKLDLFIKHLS